MGIVNARNGELIFRYITGGLVCFCFPIYMLSSADTKLESSTQFCKKSFLCLLTYTFLPSTSQMTFAEQLPGSGPVQGAGNQQKLNLTFIEIAESGLLGVLSLCRLQGSGGTQMSGLVKIAESGNSLDGLPSWRLQSRGTPWTFWFLETAESESLVSAFIGFVELGRPGVLA